MRRVIVGLSLLAACAPFEPPKPAAPRTATEVPASFGKTWDAVIDVFSEANIPIRTMERASGFVAAEVATVPSDSAAHSTGHPYADCGKLGDRFVMPGNAMYNVVVRGDSAKSTVRVTVRFTPQTGAASTSERASRGAWETAFEAGVRARATGEPLPSVLATQPPAADTARTRSDSSWVGNRRKKLYYPRGCPSETKLNERDRVYFRTSAEARAAGYRRSTDRDC
jgi:hypothetical protein